MNRTPVLSLAAAIALALAACGGGGSDPATPPVTTTTPTSNAWATPGIYVTNQNNSVTVFALDATGNAAPARTIGVFPIDASGNVAPTRSITSPGMGSPQGTAGAVGDHGRSLTTF